MYELIKLVPLLLVVLLAGCKEKYQNKVTGDPPSHPSNSFLDTLWTVPMIDGEECSPLFFAHDTLFYYADVCSGQRLYAVDPETGEIVWESNHAIFGEHLTSLNWFTKVDTKLYFISPSWELVKYDLQSDTYTVLWALPTSLDLRSFSYHDHTLYLAVNDHGLENQWVELLRLNISTGTLDTVFHLDRKSEMIPSVFSPVVTTVAGEEVIVFKCKYFTFDDATKRFADLYAINVTRDDTILWKIEKFEDSGPASTIIPWIHGDVVVVYGYRSVFGYDKTTGQELWRFDSNQSDAHFTHASNIVYNSNFIAKADNDRLISIDVLNGVVNYDLNNRGYTPHFTYVRIDDILYYSAWGEDLFIGARMGDGDLILAKKLPSIDDYEYDKLGPTFAIIKEKRIALLHNFRRLIAVQL